MEQQTVQIPNRGSKFIRYNNRILSKLPNKKIMISHYKEQDTFLITSIGFTKDPDKLGAAVEYTQFKGCVNMNNMKVTRETLEAIVQIGLQLLHDYPEPKNESTDAANP